MTILNKKVTLACPLARLTVNDDLVQSYYRYSIIFVIMRGI